MKKLINILILSFLCNYMFAQTNVPTYTEPVSQFFVDTQEPQIAIDNDSWYNPTTKAFSKFDGTEGEWVLIPQPVVPTITESALPPSVTDAGELGDLWILTPLSPAPYESWMLVGITQTEYIWKSLTEIGTGGGTGGGITYTAGTGIDISAGNVISNTAILSNAGGDLTGTYPNPTIAQKSATNGQVLTWNGSTWSPANVVSNSAIIDPNPPTSSDISYLGQVWLLENPPHTPYMQVAGENGGTATTTPYEYYNTSGYFSNDGLVINNSNPSRGQVFSIQPGQAGTLKTVTLRVRRTSGTLSGTIRLLSIASYSPGSVMDAVVVASAPVASSVFNDLDFKDLTLTLPANYTVTASNTTGFAIIFTSEVGTGGVGQIAGQTTGADDYTFGRRVSSASLLSNPITVTTGSSLFDMYFKYEIETGVSSADGVWTNLAENLYNSDGSIPSTGRTVSMSSNPLILQKDMNGATSAELLKFRSLFPSGNDGAVSSGISFEQKIGNAPSVTSGLLIHNSSYTELAAAKGLSLSSGWAGGAVDPNAAIFLAPGATGESYQFTKDAMNLFSNTSTVVSGLFGGDILYRGVTANKGRFIVGTAPNRSTTGSLDTVAYLSDIKTVITLPIVPRHQFINGTGGTTYTEIGNADFIVIPPSLDGKRIVRVDFRFGDLPPILTTDQTLDFRVQQQTSLGAVSTVSTLNITTLNDNVLHYNNVMSHYVSTGDILYLEYKSSFSTSTQAKGLTVTFTVQTQP